MEKSRNHVSDPGNSGGCGRDPAEDVNENSVMMDDLDLSSMEILTVVADLEETFGLRIPERSCATL